MAILLTVIGIVAHLTEVLFKDVMVVFALSKDHLLAEFDSLKHLLGVF